MFLKYRLNRAERKRMEWFADMDMRMQILESGNRFSYWYVEAFHSSVRKYCKYKEKARQMEAKL